MYVLLDDASNVITIFSRFLFTMVSKVRSFVKHNPKRNLNSSNIPPEGLNIIRQLYALVLLITLRATKSKSTEVKLIGK